MRLAGPQTSAVSVAGWPTWDQVSVQAGLDTWLAGPGRRHHLVAGGGAASGDLGGVSTAARPRGAGQAGLPVRHPGYLPGAGRRRAAGPLLHGPADVGPAGPVTLPVIAPDRDTGEQVLERVCALAAEHSVYRGQVISFGRDGPAAPGGGQPAFLDRPAVARALQPAVVVVEDVDLG